MLPSHLEATTASSWIHGLQAPAWVVRKEGVLADLNEPARLLLGRGGEATGSPCHEVVWGELAQGRRHCAHDCPRLVSCSPGDGHHRPLSIFVGRPPRPVRLLSVMPREEPSPDWFVEIAVEDRRSVQLEDYLERVAQRSERIRSRTGRKPLPLSRREHEILLELAADRHPKQIAHRLGLSTATVRNHVRHVLEKLGAHSIQEAVALFLLGRVR